MKVLKEEYKNFPKRTATMVTPVEGQALEDTKVFDKREEETNKEVQKNAKLPVDGAPKAVKPDEAKVPNPIKEALNEDTFDAGDQCAKVIVGSADDLYVYFDSDPWKYTDLEKGLYYVTNSTAEENKIGQFDSFEEAKQFIEADKEVKKNNNSNESLNEGLCDTTYADMLYDIIEDNKDSEIKTIAQDLIYWCGERNIKHFLEVNEVVSDEEKEELDKSDNDKAFTDYLYDLIEEDAVNYKEMAKSLVYWCNDKDLKEFMKVRNLLPDEDDEDLNEGADSRTPFTVMFFHKGDTCTGIIYAKDEKEAKEKFEKYCPSCQLDRIKKGRLGFEYPMITSGFEYEQGWRFEDEDIDESLNESVNRDFVTVEELLYGAIDNMSQEDIDRDVKLYYNMAKQFGMKSPDSIVVFLDGEHQYDPDDFEDAIKTLDKKNYSVYTFNDTKICKNVLNGINFLFFKDEAEANEYLDTIDSQYSEDLNETLDEDINPENAARVVQEVIKHKYGFDVDVATYKDSEESKCVIVEFITSKENCAKMRYDDLKEEVYKRLGSDINISCKQFSSPNLKNKGTEYKLKLFIIKEKKDKSKIYAEDLQSDEESETEPMVINNPALNMDFNAIQDDMLKDGEELEQQAQAIDQQNEEEEQAELEEGRITKMKVIKESLNETQEKKEQAYIEIEIPQSIIDASGIPDFTKTKPSGLAIKKAKEQLGHYIEQNFDGITIPNYVERDVPNYYLDFNRARGTWEGEITGTEENLKKFMKQIHVASPIDYRYSAEQFAKWGDDEGSDTGFGDIYDQIIRDLSKEFGWYSESNKRRIPGLTSDSAHKQFGKEIVPDDVRYNFNKYVSKDDDEEGTKKIENAEISVTNSGDLLVKPNKGKSLDFAKQVADEYSDYGVTSDPYKDFRGNEIGLIIHLPKEYLGKDSKDEKDRRVIKYLYKDSFDKYKDMPAVDRKKFIASQKAKFKNLLNAIENEPEEQNESLNEANYGWDVDIDHVYDAYDEACEYFGEDDLNKQIVKSMSSDELKDSLDFVFRMNDFSECSYLND